MSSSALKKSLDRADGLGKKDTAKKSCLFNFFAD